jgi:hypothetical protein
LALDRKEDRAQDAPKFELLSLPFKGFRQPRQLVQTLLELSGRFCRRPERDNGAQPWPMG